MLLLSIQYNFWQIIKYQGVKNFTFGTRWIRLNSYEVRLNQTVENLEKSKFLFCVKLPFSPRVEKIPKRHRKPALNMLNQ